MKIKFTKNLKYEKAIDIMDIIKKINSGLLNSH